MMAGSGVNLDLWHPVGKPEAAALRGFSYARLGFNVSRGTGNTDIDGAARAYGAYAQALLDGAGVRTILVLGHQTWGEERGFNWDAMTAADWERLREGFTDACGRVAAGLRGLQVIYQIWNEQDGASVAAVGVPAGEYGKLFNEAAAAIRNADRSAMIITGGYVSGPESGMAHYRAAGRLNADGVAFHPYGAAAAGLFAGDNVPPIAAQIARWKTLGVAPGRMWITEFGVLGQSGAPVADVARYSRAFMAEVHRAGLSAAVWYGWADGMHNGFGVADGAGQVRAAIKAGLTDGATAPPAPVDSQAYAAGRYLLNYPPNGAVNIRAEGRLAGAVLAKLAHGGVVEVLASGGVAADGYVWQSVQVGSVRGWMATTGGAWSLDGAPVSGGGEDRESIKAQIRALLDRL